VKWSGLLLGQAHAQVPCSCERAGWVQDRAEPGRRRRRRNRARPVTKDSQPGYPATAPCSSRCCPSEGDDEVAQASADRAGPCAASRRPRRTALRLLDDAHRVIQRQARDERPEPQPRGPLRGRRRHQVRRRGGQGGGGRRLLSSRLHPMTHPSPDVPEGSDREAGRRL